MIAAWQQNPLVADLVVKPKEAYAEDTRQKATHARSNSTVNYNTSGDGGSEADGNGRFVVKETSAPEAAFRRIENIVDDLERAGSESFCRHIKKLSRILHSDEFARITDELIARVKFNEWLESCEATENGMVGSAQLNWPEDHLEELGMTAALIDYFADDPNRAMYFSHTFFFQDGKITPELQHMTAQIIVPFARDYIDHISEQTGFTEAAHQPQLDASAVRKVFIVHGHDETAKQTVARFCEKIGFEVVILHEQPSRGRTIIEKIEDHHDVGFAIIILTPDDVGGKPECNPSPRARQNVVLELGYFLGRLGRSKVMALKKGEIEVPSDFDGVVYQDYDDHGAWKQALGRELKAAGFDIDGNLIMG